MWKLWRCNKIVKDGFNRLIVNWFKFKCNLCGEMFTASPDLKLQRIRHEDWHDIKTRMKTKNRIIGEVEWQIIPV